MCATIIKKGSWRSLYATRSAFQFIISKKKAPQTKKIQLEKQMSYIKNPHTCECVCVWVLAHTHATDRSKQNIV